MNHCFLNCPGDRVQNGDVGLRLSMEIKHDQPGARFVVATEHGDAVVEYLREGDTVDFTHTFVPPAARGKGLAEALVRRALAWAEENKLEVHASCLYVARYRQLMERRN